METFTETYIKDLVWSYHELLETERGVKTHLYRHPLQRVVVNKRLKRALGRASIRGTVELGGCFVGLQKTKENMDQISDTILHELAHLYVGIEEGHNSVWQRVAKHMGANPETYATVEGELREATRPPWLLVATLTTGKSVQCKTAHKRTLKYLRNPSAYSIGGVTVQKFEWIKLSKKVA